MMIEDTIAVADDIKTVEEEDVLEAEIQALQAVIDIIEREEINQGPEIVEGKMMTVEDIEEDQEVIDQAEVVVLIADENLISLIRNMH